MKTHNLSPKTIPAGREQAKRIAFLFLLLGFAALLPNESRAAGLEASDGVANDQLGNSVGVSGSIGLAGAFGDVNSKGRAYVFRGLDTATGPITQNAKLTASDGAAGDQFGSAVSVSGSIGLAGASGDDDNDKGNDVGSAYVFRGLDTATGPITQNAKLTASDGVASRYFGISVSVSGSTGLVGGYVINASSPGSAYVFRGLDTLNGEVTEDAKLTASDGEGVDLLGYSVSLSGNTGLVSAHGDAGFQGSVYVFRGLNTATGTVTEDAKLMASDGAAGDAFGLSVSLSGSTGLVGAFEDDSFKGSAYVFRDLDTATGAVTENAKLTASDSEASDAFGYSVSVSGSTGLVGAYGDDNSKGGAYVFLDLDTASGAVTENVKLTASDGAVNDQFGFSVSLNGDNFIIGARGKNSNKGKVYSGSVGSVTTLDTDSANRTISGISFVSRENWIIGKTTDSNSVTLKTASKADVTAKGKKVYVGKCAGSDNNTLTIDGTCIANEVQVGREGNSGNALILGSTGIITADSVTVASGSSVGGDGTIEGDLTLDAGAKLKPGTSTGLEVAGAVALDSTFGVDDILGLDGITEGTHVVISGSTTDFSALDLQNVGSANALAFGGGKTAYLGVSVDGDLTLTVIFPKPVVTSVATASGKVGTMLTYQIMASNSPASYGATGLPAGVTVSASTGLISGKPTKSGTFTVNLSARNGGGTGTKTLTLKVFPPTPVITSVATVSGKVGTTVIYQITATNIPTAYSATGLPAGLMISTTTGKIAGRPTKVGTFNATVKATNAGGTGTKVVKFNIANETTVPVLTVTTPAALNATITAASFTVKGNATDNISPVKVEYRIDPPTLAGYGAYKAIALSGTATSKAWSYKADTKLKGIWKIQFRAFDAAGNISAVKTVTITRK
jgi:hypothetical protein